MKENILTQIPLTYTWFLKKLFTKDIKTVLDVACGDGRLLASILGSKHRFKIVGIDLDNRYLRKAKATGVYDNVFRVDLSQPKWRNIDNRKYDLVFCSQVIEHLDKKEGEKLLDKLDVLARRKIYVGTVRGSVAFKPYDGEGETVAHQQHKSTWDVGDFTGRGYEVYGQGLPFVFAENSFVRKLPKILQKAFFVLSYLASPILFFYPKRAHTLLALKSK